MEEKKKVTGARGEIWEEKGEKELQESRGGEGKDIQWKPHNSNGNGLNLRITKMGMYNSLRLIE